MIILALSFKVPKALELVVLHHSTLVRNPQVKFMFCDCENYLQDAV